MTVPTGTSDPVTGERAQSGCDGKGAACGWGEGEGQRGALEGAGGDCFSAEEQVECRRGCVRDDPWLIAAQVAQRVLAHRQARWGQQAGIVEHDTGARPEGRAGEAGVLPEDAAPRSAPFVAGLIAVFANGWNKFILLPVIVVTAPGDRLAAVLGLAACNAVWAAVAGVGFVAVGIRICVA